MKPSIKAVIFDVGGVLVGWQGYGMDEDLKRELGFNDEILKVFRENHYYSFSKGEVSEEEMWKSAAKDMGIRQVSVEEDLLGRAFAKSFQAYTEVINYANSLVKRGIKIAILSNTNASHATIVRRNRVYEGFEDIFLSHEIGLRKPDHKIYKFALNKLDLKPGEVIFIDDSADNIKAAKDLGINTVLAKNPTQVIDDIEKLLL